MVQLAEGQPAQWKWELGISADLTPIHDLTTVVKGKTLRLAHNKPGDASGSMPITHEFAADVEPIRTCLMCKRNGVLVWSGLIWPTEEQPDTEEFTINAIGWLTILEHRVMRSVVQPDGVGPYINIDDGQIILDLLEHANTNGPLPTYIAEDSSVHTAPSSTFMMPGTRHYSHPSEDALRNRTFEKWAQILAEIDNLCGIENGADIRVTPDDRSLEVYRQKMVDQTEVLFGYNRPPNNIVSMGRANDPSSMVNWFRALGKYGEGFAQDVASQAYYCLLEETSALTDVVDPDVLAAYAGGEVVLRAAPRETPRFTPFPWTYGSGVPEPLVDYDIGDKVRFSALKGRLDVTRQSVRIFGINFTIDDEGNEKLADLQISP